MHKDSLYNYLTEYLGVAPDYYEIISDTATISKWAGRRVYYSYKDADGVRHLAGGKLEKFTARDEEGVEQCIIDHLSLNMNALDVDANGNTGNEYLDGLPAGDEWDDLIMNTVVLENMPGVPSDTSANANTSTAPKSASELRKEKLLSGDFTDREFGWTSREYKRTSINGWDYDWQDGWHKVEGRVWDFGTCPNDLWMFRPVYDERTVNYVPELPEVPKENVTPKEEPKVRDNEVSKSGSKGDFIFRDTMDDIEYISIMFEMKNECDTTASKHKNEDFFKELDKDRKEKKCEYAVLVSMLEADNDCYNQGIVDVSYRYNKMYVIRPQFFIPFITMLQNASMGSAGARRELVKVKQENFDVVKFMDGFEDFKSKFGRNYSLAEQRFTEAIANIDKTIDYLQKVRDALTISTKHLSAANKQAQDLSIKKLTKDNPGMLERFKKEGYEA